MEQFQQHPEISFLAHDARIAFLCFAGRKMINWNWNQKMEGVSKPPLLKQLMQLMVPRSEDPCRPGLSRIALQARLLRYCGMGPFVLSCVVSRLVVSPCLLACSHLVNNAWLAVSAAELLFLSLTKKNCC